MVHVYVAGSPLKINAEHHYSGACLLILDETKEGAQDVMEGAQDVMEGSELCADVIKCDRPTTYAQAQYLAYCMCMRMLISRYPAHEPVHIVMHLNCKILVQQLNNVSVKRVPSLLSIGQTTMKMRAVVPAHMRITYKHVHDGMPLECALRCARNAQAVRQHSVQEAERQMHMRQHGTQDAECQRDMDGLPTGDSEIDEIDEIDAQ